jgi:hypothetical protein
MKTEHDVLTELVAAHDAIEVKYTSRNLERLSNALDAARVVLKVTATEWSVSTPEQKEENAQS